MKIGNLVDALNKIMAEHGDLPVMSCNCIEQNGVASDVSLKFAHFDENGAFEYCDEDKDAAFDGYTAKPICWLAFGDEPSNG